MTAIQKIKNLRLFRRHKKLETARQIILWWELRRISFNLIVGFVGIFTLVFLFALEMLLNNDYLDEILPNPPTLAIFATELGLIFALQADGLRNYLPELFLGKNQSTLVKSCFCSAWFSLWV
jgi:hypothetical protein